ncbi:IclR family transcriptional regulator [Acuticoccus mangrovi]|uniref:IclR family transcriptional regulator n=1 Tax=Acuticoccus mangrovi TaxID=2796142 RepID=A0A934MHZ8_9HYPH|nr:IclR family transcriptional regulator [Acuticoccus mangrovi]MBJ3776636.1 IclR family transcriptional regulator [Acuticoccus mangrovi]
MSNPPASGENQSVARALSILDLLADSPEPLGVREIARRLGLPPSNVQRLIKTLTRAGYLEQADATLRYAIGYRAFQVGNAFVGQTSLVSAVMPELYALADEHITGFLGVMRDRSVVYLATVQSEGPVAINHRPGHQTHLHSTAMGKALLAEMSDEAVISLLGSDPLPRITQSTRIELPQLLADLAEYRKLGYSYSDEENRQGFFSAGAVVRDATGGVVAVLSGAVPAVDLAADARARIGMRVHDAAQRASRKLGAPTPRAFGHPAG